MSPQTNAEYAGKVKVLPSVQLGLDTNQMFASIFGGFGPPSQDAAFTSEPRSMVSPSESCPENLSLLLETSRDDSPDVKEEVDPETFLDVRLEERDIVFSACRFCDEQFGSEAELSTHQKLVHIGTVLVADIDLKKEADSDTIEHEEIEESETRAPEESETPAPEETVCIKVESIENEGCDNLEIKCEAADPLAAEVPLHHIKPEHDAEENLLTIVKEEEEEGVDPVEEKYNIKEVQVNLSNIGTKADTLTAALVGTSSTPNVISKTTLAVSRTPIVVSTTTLKVSKTPTIVSKTTLEKSKTPTVALKTTLEASRTPTLSSKTNTPGWLSKTTAGTTTPAAGGPLSELEALQREAAQLKAPLSSKNENVVQVKVNFSMNSTEKGFSLLLKEPQRDPPKCQVRDKRTSCDMCDKTFLRPKDLAFHVKRVHYKMLSCKLCDFTTKNQFYLTQHVELDHQGRGHIFHCGKHSCLQPFSSHKLKRNHEYKEHGELYPMKCPKCQKVFKKYMHGAIYRHILKCTMRAVYKCPFCSTTYQRAKQLSSHMMESHNFKYDGSGRQYAVEPDKESLALKGKLKLMSSIKEEEKLAELCRVKMEPVNTPQLLKCPFDDEEYNSMQAFHLHLHKEHLNVDVPCPVGTDEVRCCCGTYFNCRKSLEHHASRCAKNRELDRTEAKEGFEGDGIEPDTNLILRRVRALANRRGAFRSRHGRLPKLPKYDRYFAEDWMRIEQKVEEKKKNKEAAQFCTNLLDKINSPGTERGKTEDDSTSTKKRPMAPTIPRRRSKRRRNSRYARYLDSASDTPDDTDDSENNDEQNAANKCDNSETKQQLPQSHEKKGNDSTTKDNHDNGLSDAGEGVLTINESNQQHSLKKSESQDIITDSKKTIDIDDNDEVIDISPDEIVLSDDDNDQDDNGDHKPDQPTIRLKPISVMTLNDLQTKVEPNIVPKKPSIPITVKNKPNKPVRTELVTVQNEQIFSISEKILDKEELLKKDPTFSKPRIIEEKKILCTICERRFPSSQILDHFCD